jgi:hypothetical protein
MLIPMSTDQRRHLDAFERAWPRYAALLRGRADLAGGMHWKPAAGAEYLTRYWSDPATGKKVGKSLGRRSPETEALHREYFKRRAAAERDESELEPKVRTAGMFARALRLTRLPARHAEGLRNLHESGLLDEGRALALGTPAVLLYEAKARVVAPPGALKGEDDLAFLLPGDGGVSWDEGMDFAIAFGGRKARVGTTRAGEYGRTMSVDGMTIALASRAGLVEAAREGEASTRFLEALDEALRAPSVEGFAFAKDATLAPVRAPDPRAFCLMAPLFAADDRDRLEAAWERVDAVDEMTRRGFEPSKAGAGMTNALAELREIAGPGRLSAPPRL